MSLLIFCTRRCAEDLTGEKPIDRCEMEERTVLIANAPTLLGRIEAAVRGKESASSYWKIHLKRSS